MHIDDLYGGIIRSPKTLKAFKCNQIIVIWVVAGHIPIIVDVDRLLKRTTVILKTSNSHMGIQLQTSTYMKRATIERKTRSIDCFLHRCLIARHRALIAKLPTLIVKT